MQGIRVLDEVAPSWESVAPFLGFDENMIKTIQRDMHGDASRGCRLMFEKWLKGASHQPPTWETLAGALNQAELNALANKIETEVVRDTSGATSGGSNSTPIPAMSQASTAQLPHANGKVKYMYCLLNFTLLRGMFSHVIGNYSRTEISYQTNIGDKECDGGGGGGGGITQTNMIHKNIHNERCD